MPVIDQGPFGYKQLNVAGQQAGRDSFLQQIKALVAVRRQMPEVGWACPEIVETGQPVMLGLKYNGPDRVVIVLHNLAGTEVDSGSPPTAEARLPSRDFQRLPVRSSQRWQVGAEHQVHTVPLVQRRGTGGDWQHFGGRGRVPSARKEGRLAAECLTSLKHQSRPGPLVMAFPAGADDVLATVPIVGRRELDERSA